MTCEILDATAGYRHMWKGKYQNVLFLDIRKEVRPDIVASNEYLPFRPQTFEKVVYDPPHCILSKHCAFPKEEEIIEKYGKNYLKNIMKKYGMWKSRKDYLRNIISINREAKRILKQNGALFIKHTEVKGTRISHKFLINLMDNFEVKRIRRQLSGSHLFKNTVYYITMRCKNDMSIL